MKKTHILVNQSKKEVNMSVSGRMEMEDAKLFLNEYQAKINPLKGSEYILIVDCTKMEVLTPEMSESLADVMKMYKETGFKKVTYKIQKNVVLKMQLSRIARNAGLTQAEVVESA